MASPAAERVTYLVGGAALGAIGTAAYLKFSQKPKPAAISQPVPVATQPVPGPPGGPQRSLDKIENAKTILPFGFPGPVNDIVYRNAYVVSYNRRDRNPNWVAEHLTPASLKRQEGVDRAKSNFSEDTNIPVQFRARLQDYYKSGFDRGHMVPAADVKFNQEAMNETFYLTNISPQVGEGFNRDYWAHMENFCRSLTKTFPDVYVFTGPLYLPHQEADGKFYVKYQVIGNPPNVAVPTHFYKVILTQKNGKYSVGAFVLPNAPISDDIPLEQFRVPLDAVERGAGLTFFDRMNKDGLYDLCKETKCQIVLSKFHEAQKQQQKKISA
ncbi:hypothetical protein BDA99DRAFT_429661 [Phascolomyces articulosus]|uniref:Endonuclease n=1 Tax=Phascolomyces articulosus TaxID=60185 RepID=A0AAD5PJ95_9FUNG|nr:hypothetical protein BDA99DRAFT_429661 [Phascolomyces articulosus]